jgi:hypothetical protein
MENSWTGASENHLEYEQRSVRRLTEEERRCAEIIIASRMFLYRTGTGKTHTIECELPFMEKNWKMPKAEDLIKFTDKGIGKDDCNQCLGKLLSLSKLKDDKGLLEEAGRIKQRSTMMLRKGWIIIHGMKHRIEHTILERIKEGEKDLRAYSMYLDDEIEAIRRDKAKELRPATEETKKVEIEVETKEEKMTEFEQEHKKVLLEEEMREKKESNDNQLEEMEKVLDRIQGFWVISRSTREENLTWDKMKAIIRREMKKGEKVEDNNSQMEKEKKKER